MGQNLRGRLVRSHLLLSCMDSQTKQNKQKTLKFFFVFRKSNYKFLMNLSPPLYVLSALDETANFPYVAS